MIAVKFFRVESEHEGDHGFLLDVEVGAERAIVCLQSVKDRCADYLLRRPARANKPKALSAPTTTELGTKTRSDGGTVLLADKTLPCPNRVRFLLTHDESV